jgi:phage shock protein A
MRWTDCVSNSRNLHVTDLRSKVDSLDDNLRQQVADLQIPSLQRKLDGLDADIRQQVNDLATTVARLEVENTRLSRELQQAATRAPAAPPAVTTGTSDELRAMIDQVRQDLTSLTTTVETQEATFKTSAGGMRDQVATVEQAS